MRFQGFLENSALGELRRTTGGFEAVLLDRKLQSLADRISSKPQITVTWFRPDQKKTGGAYVTTTGQLKKLDDYAGALIMMGGERIVIENILDIQ